jgi:hypothetical protein
MSSPEPGSTVGVGYWKNAAWPGKLTPGQAGSLKFAALRVTLPPCTGLTVRVAVVGVTGVHPVLDHAPLANVGVFGVGTHTVLVPVGVSACIVEPVSSPGSPAQPVATTTSATARSDRRRSRWRGGKEDAAEHGVERRVGRVTVSFQPEAKLDAIDLDRLVA